MSGIVSLPPGSGGPINSLAPAPQAQGTALPPHDAFSIGTVTTLAPGAQATVTMTGVYGAQKINFGLPQGATGLATSPASSSSIGSVFAGSGSANQFMTGIVSGTGALVFAQPSFSNISGTAAPGQLPAATNSNPGALPTLSGNAAQYLSGAGTWLGFPAPGASALGALYSSNAPANNFCNGLDTSGNLFYAQPSFGNLSGVAASAQLPAATGAALGAVISGANLTNSSGTLSLTGANVSGALGYVPGALGAIITGCLPSAIAGTNTTAILGVSAGSAADSTGAAALIGIGYLWAVSNGNAINGFQGGATLPNSTTIHFFLCRGGSGTGVFASTSENAPTLPAGYNSYFRRIFSILTTAAGALIPYTPIEYSGGGMICWLSTQIEDISTSALGTSRVLYYLIVPSGIKVQPIIRATASGASNAVILTSGDETDVAPSTGATVPLEDLGSIYSGSDAMATPILTTNTAGQIGARAAATSTNFYLVTRGFIDFRRN